MPADGVLHTSEGFLRGLATRQCPSIIRAWVYFALVLIISMVFHWNVFTSLVRPQDLSVDTYFYLESARELQKFFAGEEYYIDPLRTPGYPLIILGLARLQGVDMKNTGMSAEGWDNPNPSGLALLQSLQVVQQALFFCLPLLIFGVFFLVSRSPLVGFLCSMSYYVDTGTLLYQHAILVEGISIVCTWISILGFVCFMRRPRLWILGVLALLLGVFIWIRPPLALFAPLYAVGIFFVLLRSRSWKRALAAVAGFVGGSALLPLLWCFFHLFFGIGHFMYTSNAVFTLQLFAAPRLMQMQVPDHDLNVMKKHIYLYRKNGGQDGFVMTAVQQDVMRELGMTHYDYYKLKQKAVRLTIEKYPLDLLKMGWTNFKFVWMEENLFHPSFEIVMKLPKTAFFHLLGTQFLPFGPVTLPVLAILCIFLAVKTPDRTQSLFLWFHLAFVVLFTYLCTLISPDCPERHTVQARLVIFALSFYCLAQCLAMLGRRLLARFGREDSGVSLFQNGALAVAVAFFGLWLPLHARYDRNFSDLQEIRSALESYRAAHGAYPVSRGWSAGFNPNGYLGPDAYSGPDWVPGLVPDYLTQLPQDPRNRIDQRTQYLYCSDGKDYKLISNGAYDCYQISKRFPERIDPVRYCIAYGYWTDGAHSW